MQFGEIILGERKGTHNPNLEKLTSSSPTWPPKDFDLLQSAAQDNRHPCASVCLLGGGEGWASLPSHVAVWAPRRSPSVFQTHQRRAGERDTGDTRGAQCSRCSAQASYQSCGNAMLRAKSTWPRTSANIWGVPDSAGATGAASQAPASKTKRKKCRTLVVGNVQDTCAPNPTPHQLNLSSGHESLDCPTYLPFTADVEPQLAAFKKNICTTAVQMSSVCIYLFILDSTLLSLLLSQVQSNEMQLASNHSAEQWISFNLKLNLKQKLKIKERNTCELTSQNFVFLYCYDSFASFWLPIVRGATLQLAANHHCCIFGKMLAHYEANQLVPPGKSFTGHFSLTDIHLIKQSQ